MNNTDQRLGWIGLGNMGHPMAKNLEKAGFPLSVYNRTAEKTKDFTAPVQACTSIAELVQQSDIIFTMLTNDAAVQVVYDAIGNEAIEGKLFVDMSAISQELSVHTAEVIKKKGGAFVDAPVAGSTQPAKEGTLIIMAGGEDADVQRAVPYLEKLGRLVKHLGDNGKGIAAKLAVNYFLSAIYQGLAEAVLFAGQLGVARKDLLHIINESASGSGATRVKTLLLLEENYQAAFALDLMLKDIKLAKDAGANYPLLQALLPAYQGAHDAGLGEEDVIGIIRYLNFASKS